MSALDFWFSDSSVGAQRATSPVQLRSWSWHTFAKVTPDTVCEVQEQHTLYAERMYLHQVHAILAWLDVNRNAVKP